MAAIEITRPDLTAGELRAAAAKALFGITLARCCRYIRFQPSPLLRFVATSGGQLTVRHRPESHHVT